MPNRQTELPGTIRRSPPKARRTYKKVLENAEEQYGRGERASRTAYAALKHAFERVEGRWEPKGRKGPSDPRSRKTSTEAKRRGEGETFGGVDLYGNTKEELYERARRLDIAGRSRMSKKELARAIARAQ